jgi:hypothetical protein
MQRACNLKAQQQLLLLKAIWSSRPANLFEEYQRLRNEFEVVALAHAKHGGGRTVYDFDYGHRIVPDSLRLGSRESDGFWRVLNARARKNTQFIMNLAQIDKTFKELSTVPPTLPSVEKAVSGLVTVLGFQNTTTFFDYLQKKPNVDDRMMEDGTVLLACKKEASVKLLDILPSTKEEEMLVQAHRTSEASQAEEVQRLIFMLQECKVDIRPMASTPYPAGFKDEVMFVLPPFYDVSLLRAEYDNINKRILELRAVTDPNGQAAAAQEIATLKRRWAEASNAFVVDAYNFWRTTFDMLMKKEAIIAAYKAEVENIKAVQVNEANRVVGELLGALSNARLQLTALVLLIAEYSVLIKRIQEESLKGSLHAAKVSRDQSLVLGIQKAVNQFVSAFNMQPSFDYAQVFLEILALPKEAIAFRKYLHSKGLPPAFTDGIQSSTTKRDLIKLTALWYMYGVAE